MLLLIIEKQSRLHKIQNTLQPNRLNPSPGTVSDYYNSRPSKCEPFTWNNLAFHTLPQRRFLSVIPLILQAGMGSGEGTAFERVTKLTAMHVSGSGLVF